MSAVSVRQELKTRWRQYIIALAGSLCYGPVAGILPVAFWFKMSWEWLRRGGIKMSNTSLTTSQRCVDRPLPQAYAAGALHAVLFLVMCLVTVGGTYAVVMQIKLAYDEGTVAGVFDCGDTSGLAE